MNLSKTPVDINGNPLSMAWYKFLICFALIAGAIVNLIYSLSYILGTIYLVETSGEVSAEQVYAHYGTGLQVVDVFYGFFLIAFAILAFVVRHKLANYEPDSLKFVKIFYSLSAGVPFLYAVLVSAITGQSPAVLAVTSTIIEFVFLLLNIRYFNKRAHLFVDKTSSYNITLKPLDLISTENARQDTAVKPVPVTHALNHTATVKKNRRKPIIIGIIIILVLALAVGIVALLINNNNEDNDTNDDRPATVYNVAVRTISLSDKFTAEYVIAIWKNGKATEQTMIEIMNEYGAEQGGGKLYVIERGEFIEEIDEWCFSSKRKVGDYSIIENAYGYTICYISGFNKEDSDSLHNDNTPSYEDIGVTIAQYTLAEIISDDPVTYCEYIVEIDKTLSKGSYGIDLQKEKVTDYVNNLPLDYGQRIILFKIQFPTDTTYCNDIVDYLNEREDISYDDEMFILEELGFAVFEDGTVKW